MKKRNVIILVVMLIVGFAAVTSTLVINGVFNIGENKDDFKIIFTSASIDGTIEILADSDYSFNESNYAVLVFEVKNNFKKNNKSDVFLYDYTASGPEKIKFRFEGSKRISTTTPTITNIIITNK